MVATCRIGWSLSIDRLVFLMAGASAATSAGPRTTRHSGLSAHSHCAVATYTESVWSAASDSWRTSPTTPATTSHGLSAGPPKRSRWPMGSRPGNLRRAKDYWWLGSSPPWWRLSARSARKTEPIPPVPSRRTSV